MSKYPNIEIELVGQDGNAFAILGRFRRVLVAGGVPSAEIETIMADAMSGDYNHLLQVVMATVEVSMAWEDEDDDWDDDDSWSEDAYDEYGDDDVYDHAEAL